MGDLTTLAKARMELEELYMGIPDDSVNLTFQDLAEVTQKAKPSEKKKTSSMELVSQVEITRKGSALSKLPSLDFSKALEASNHRDHHHHLDHVRVHESHHSHAAHGHRYSEDSLQSHGIPNDHHSGFRHTVEGHSVAYDDVSGMTGMSGMASEYREGGGRRRPGIPHSNICTVCSTYVYIFRHRCLVCGRAYCRQCINTGMGEMTEGRKCIECLGRRFSQRYIERAGKMGCCFGYPGMAKLAELKWAEKGPRRSGERAYGHVRTGVRTGVAPSRSRSPMTPRSYAAGANPPSFVASSTYSPYSTPTHHHLPF